MTGFQFFPDIEVMPSGLDIQTMLVASTAEVAGENYLVFGYLDSNAEFQFARMRDSDDDGYPDAATATVFLDTNETVYVTYLPPIQYEFTPFLDLRCQDIRLARDSDGDGWIDLWLPAPFARSADHPELSTARTISRQSGAGGLQVAAAEDNLYGHRGARALSRGATHLLLTDTDADQVADEAITPAARSLRPSVIPMLLRAGSQSLYVMSAFGGSGRAVEVWSVDSSGDDVALLGSVTLAADRDPHEVTLTPALSNGQRISVRFADDVAEARLYDVLSSGPAIYAIDPMPLPADEQARSITVRGSGFDASAGLTLYLGRTGESLVLVTNFADSTTLTATMPALGADQVGSGVLCITVSGEPAGDPLAVQVCDP